MSEDKYCCPIGAIYHLRNSQFIKAIGLPSGKGEDLAFAAINRSPIIPGDLSSLYAAEIRPFSLMLLPVRHTIHSHATNDELASLRDLQGEMLEKMVTIYEPHGFMPFVVENPYAPHASISSHMHRHLVPSPVDQFTGGGTMNLRSLTLSANYHLGVPLDLSCDGVALDNSYYEEVCDLLKK